MNEEMKQKMIKSAKLGLVGLVGGLLVQWLESGTFSGTWAPIVAALLPVIKNFIDKLMAEQTKPTEVKPEVKPEEKTEVK